MKELNVNAGTITGMLGYETPEDATDNANTKELAFIALAMHLNKNPSEAETLTIVLHFIADESLESNADLFKYLWKLDADTLENMTATILDR